MFFKQRSVAEKAAALAALGLLGGVWLSWPLWNEAARLTFPVLPLWDDATFGHGNGLHSIFQEILTLGLILSAVIFPLKRWPLALLTVWLLWLCCLDLNRLQPWVWFYLLVFSIALFAKRDDETSTANALRWLLAGVYFWSGFNKLTPYFAEDNFAWFCSAFRFTKNFGQHPALGYAVAFFEMTFAAGLLWEKTRPCFRWIAIGFHAIVIFFLIKLDWNWVVIPWNLAMAGMVWTLNPTPDPSPTGRGVRDNVAERSTPPLPVGEGSGVGLTRGAASIIALTWFAPFLCFFHLWPFALSWQLYSNTQPEATFYCESKQVKFFCKTAISENREEKMWQKLSFDDNTKLLFDDWATDELRVPMFAAERTFRQTGKYLCRCAASPDSAGIYILSVNRWDKLAETMKKVPCRELMMNDK